MKRAESEWDALWLHRPRMLRIARGYGFSAAEAEDLVGDILYELAVMDDLDLDRVEGLAVCAVTRRCLREIAARTRHRRLLAPLLADGRLAERPLDEAACDRFYARWLVERIPERQRRVALLQAEGLSITEIAGRTGWSYSVVDRLLTQGRRHLRQLAGVPLVVVVALWRRRTSAVTSTATVAVALAGFSAVMKHDISEPRTVTAPAFAPLTQTIAEASLQAAQRSPARGRPRAADAGSAARRAATPHRPAAPTRRYTYIARTELVGLKAPESESLPENVKRCVRNGVEVATRIDGRIGVVCRDDTESGTGFDRPVTGTL